MLLDVDTGVDDAVAIALATRLIEHELVALTTVAGNVPIEFATSNTLRVVSWLGIDVPVFRGASSPLVRRLVDAREHHGYDGLGGWNVPVEPAPLSDITAPEVIVRLAREYRDGITFVFVGPLTNLAVALNLEPRIVEWSPRLVVMGGAFFGPGNVTSHAEFAEFNVFVDPEAAALVMRSGLSVNWVPLDVTRQTTLTRDTWQRLEAAEECGKVLVREVMRRTFVDLGRSAFPLHDPLAVAVAERPSIVDMAVGLATVETGEHERGRTRLAEAAGETVSSVARGVRQDEFGDVFRRLVPEFTPR
jgi:inosine-uridine nucleoside N-ribohydrolase